MSTGNSWRRVGQIRMPFESCFPHPSRLSIHDKGPIKFGCLREVVKIYWVTMFENLNRISVGNDNQSNQQLTYHQFKLDREFDEDSIQVRCNCCLGYSEGFLRMSSKVITYCELNILLADEGRYHIRMETGP